VGNITVSLLQLCFALLHVSVVVYLVAYGFKSPIASFAYLELLELALGHDVKIDAGKSVKAKRIPVFQLKDGFYGMVYPMFYGMEYKDAAKDCG